MDLSRLTRDEVSIKYALAISIFNQQKNAADGILAVSRFAEREMKNLMATQNLPSLRIFSFEEVADDTAVRILKAMGIKVEDFESLWFKAADSYQPDTSTQCKAVFASGAVPNYLNWTS